MKKKAAKMISAAFAIPVSLLDATLKPSYPTYTELL